VAPCVDGTSYVDPFGLQPTFDYYYVVRAEDSSFGGGGLCQNGAEDLNSVELSITTSSGCSTTPNRVPVLTVTSTDGTNKLRWVTPPTGSSLTIRFSDVSPPVTEADGQELVPLSAFTPNSKGFIDHTGLNNDTSYFYGAFVFNGEDKYATATSTSGRPEDTLAATNPVKWVYSTGATSLTAPGIGSVYVVSNDNIVHSMNPLDGDWPPLWKPFFRMKEPAQGRPSVLPIPIAGASKALFPGSQDGHVYAVNGLTGESLWRKRITTEDVQAAPGGLFTAFGGSYNLVLVGTKNTLSDNVFYALNPDTGSVAWSFDNGGGIGIISGQASVDYSNRRVYFASYAGLDPNTLWCLDFDSSGASLGWAQPLGNIGGSPVLYKGKIYVGTTGGVVYALDADDGAILWSRPLGDGAVKGFIWPDFGANRLYLSTDGMVWALRDLSTGSSIDWSVPISGPSVPLLVPNTKYIYVGSGDGNFYQLDRTQLPPTSKSVMLGATPATVGAASMDVVNSMLFVGTSTGAIYAIVFPFP
jgi:outer membrane protein assembly factor BamB